MININGEKDPAKLDNVAALIAKPSKPKPVAAKVEKKADAHDKPAADEDKHDKTDEHDAHAAPAAHH